MRTIVTVAMVVVAVAAAWLLRHSWGRLASWEALARPGPLARAHAALDDECSACHAGIDGVRAELCKACHSGDRALVGRQPTAFHARIDRCAECHLEHRGRDADIVRMDHVALAEIGLGTVEAHGRLPAAPSGDDPRTQVLDCIVCHGNQDRHLGRMGRECGDCHVTARWTVAGYRHPTPRSRDCDQCHQAPPSHLMEHFVMVSQRAARQPHARVEECYLCHQTTAWNDILGVGYYKHH